MAMEIYTKFRIDAAHYFPNVPEDHKCHKLHGHSFLITIFVTGNVDQHFGWIIDFDEIKSAFEPIKKQLDHACLNDINGLENPTSENIARWIWEFLKPSLPLLSKIKVAETPRSGAIYRGEKT